MWETASKSACLLFQNKCRPIKVRTTNSLSNSIAEVSHEIAELSYSRPLTGETVQRPAYGGQLVKKMYSAEATADLYVLAYTISL